MSQQNNIIAQIVAVSKSFGEVVAVSDSTLSVVEGSVTGFLGPNGSGKTTSIKMLLGLIKPQQGKVSLFGVDPFITPKIKQLIGYIPEENAFPSWLRGYDYLKALAQFNLPYEVAKRRATEVLQEVELEHVADKRIRQYSKGMKQRMKIAQALLHKPKFVIGDEPFNGLDPLIRRKMFQLIEQYRQENGTTFLISSHILFEVDRLADKIVLMYKGRTIAQGTPIRIREMIQDQPHEILITSEKTKSLANLLISQSSDRVLSSIKFSKNYFGEDQMIILTLDPNRFYSLLTDIVVDNGIEISDLRGTDEGLENLFKVLTIG
ncbi:MAG: ABC transporter ATP-binding protein [Candidatus Heimdallarchaeota archaeon]|nr:ABC transporter ATP-binding protein [Candidatus Heimdallarchaeota archaeon]